MIYTFINSIIESTKVRLKENIGGVYKYSSTQVEIPHDIAEKVLAFTLSISDEKVYTDPEDPSLGRELEPHVTIKYGLETKLPDEVEALVKDEKKAIEVTLKTISLFEPEDKPYDVLKIDVESKDLSRLHDLFSQLPNQDTHPEYKPHCTLAYVKKGQGRDYLNNTNFDGMTFKTDCFYFKGSDGSSKKIELSVVPFNEENMNKSLNQFLNGQKPETDETGEMIKGQNPVSTFVPFQ